MSVLSIKINNKYSINTFHVIVGLIVAVFLFINISFSESNNLWRILDDLIIVTVFYIHALIFIPKLLKTEAINKYLIYTFSLFAIAAVGSSVIIIASKSDYIYTFTRILHDGPAFGTSLEKLYEAKFLNALLVFALSFIYGILVFKEKDKLNYFGNLIFDRQPTELLLHFIFLFVLLITLYFANILFSNIVLACLILFYFHLQFTSPILLKAKRLNIFSIIVFIELLLFCGLTAYFTTFQTLLLISLCISLMTISTIYAIIRHQIKESEFIFSQKEIELGQLKSQINPHFLFNSLNTLYGFAIKEEAENTASSIKKFSNLIRFTISDIKKDFIPLEKEIGYIKDYIEIQLARCPVEQKIELSFNNFEEYRIAPMLLIPFIENAFKHGINPVEESTLIINLKCNSGTIIFECINSIKKQNQNDIEEDGFGIGIENVKSRLSLIYPEKHYITIVKEESLFKVKLEIYDKSNSN